MADSMPRTSKTIRLRAKITRGADGKLTRANDATTPAKAPNTSDAKSASKPAKGAK